MEFPQLSSPHAHLGTGVGAMMRQVIYALAPGIAVYAWQFGWGVIVNLVIATAAALAAEAAVLAARHRPIAPVLADGSAALTGVLLALALPPLSPWWLPALGSAFAIVFVKQLYGGLGYNAFNPAMAGYAMLLIAFPVEMTRWSAALDLAPQALTLGQTVALSLTDVLPQGLTTDALTMATPLDQLRTQIGLGQSIGAIRQASPIFGTVAGHGGEWVSAAFLAGGVWLMLRRVITWHIPVAMLGAMALMATVFWMSDAARYASPLFHLFAGAAMLGAFFIATDPITASTTPRGRLWYAAGCGTLTYVIRTWGGYPDGVAFGVLLMNMAVPTIDHFTRPRVFGHQRGQGQ
jgi:electron transport complex protein RnfD